MFNRELVLFHIIISWNCERYILYMVYILHICLQSSCFLHLAVLLWVSTSLLEHICTWPYNTIERPNLSSLDTNCVCNWKLTAALCCALVNIPWVASITIPRLAPCQWSYVAAGIRGSIFPVHYTMPTSTAWIGLSRGFSLCSTVQCENDLKGGLMLKTLNTQLSGVRL